MLQAMDFIFRPLARLAMAQGLRFADLSEQLRRAFVAEAQARLGEGANVSKLSVMTGLQRRDVARVLDLEPVAVPAPDSLSRLVAQWLARYDGAPLPQHGPAPSYDALARDIRKDVHPRALLDRLIEAGTVALQGDAVHLIKKAYVPLEGSEAQLDYLGRNVGDHLEAAVGNVLGAPMSFELAVHYDGLAEADVAVLEEMWRAEMRPVLERLNAEASKRQKRGAGAARFRAGGYFYRETKE